MRERPGKCNTKYGRHRSVQAALDCPVHGIRQAKPATSSQAMQRPAIANRRARERAAESPHTPPEELDVLARDEDSGVRWAVARNESTSAHALLTLASDPDAAVRSEVAERDDAPEAALVSLARDGLNLVRQAVARHPNATASVMEMMASDPTEGVRLRAARNPCIQGKTLEMLASDREPEVAEAARVHIKKQISERFDIDPENETALSQVAALEWWSLEKGAPEIEMAKALHRNR